MALATLILAIGLAGGASAECSQGQMAEAQLQFGGAQQLLQAQQWNEAIAQLQSIVDFCPEFFPALRGLGLAYQQTGQLDLAAEVYGKVIDVQGTSADAGDYANLAKVLTKQKKYKEARAEYIKAQKRDSENCAVLVNLGILHNASGYATQAVETLEDALMYCPDLEPQIMPRLADACTKAAEKMTKIGNTEKASMYKAKAREYGGSAGGSSAYKQIQAKMKAGDYAGTVASCDALLADEPEHANALLTKARAADAMGNKAVSADAYKKYLVLKPDNMDETASYIIVLAEGNMCEQAAAVSKDAVSKFIGNGTKAMGKIRFAYGKALYCLEDYASSKAEFQKAASSGDQKWVPHAREGISACDEFLNFEEAQRQKANQGR